jgi:hypothetical protein
MALVSMITEIAGASSVDAQLLPSDASTPSAYGSYTYASDDGNSYQISAMNQDATNGTLGARDPSLKPIPFDYQPRKVVGRSNSGLYYSLPCSPTNSLYKSRTNISFTAGLITYTVVTRIGEYRIISPR